MRRDQPEVIDIARTALGEWQGGGEQHHREDLEEKERQSGYGKPIRVPALCSQARAARPQQLVLSFIVIAMRRVVHRCVACTVVLRSSQ